MFTLFLAIWFLAMNRLFPEARVMRKTVFNVRNLSGTFAIGSKGALVKD
jgi:hypothetical protein